MNIQVIENGFTVNNHDWPSRAIYCKTVDEVLEHVKNNLSPFTPTNIGAIAVVSAAEAAADQERVYKLANEGKI